MLKNLMDTGQPSPPDFRAILDGMDEPCCIIDPAWNYVYLNAACARVAGQPVERLNGRNLFDVHPLLNGSELFGHLRRVMDSGNAETFECADAAAAGLSGRLRFAVRPVAEGIFVHSWDSASSQAAETALRERVKELHCIYEVFRLTDRMEGSIDEMFGKIVGLLPAAWMHADDAGARIRYQDRVHLSEGFDEVTAMQTATFGSLEIPGSISVAYRNEHVERDEGPFLREERVLLDAVALCLDSVIERQRIAATLARNKRAMIAIGACNLVIMRADSEAALLREICETVVARGGYRMAWIGLAEQDAARSVRAVAWAGIGTDYAESLKVSWGDDEWGRGPTGRAVRERRPVLARQILTQPDYGVWREAALAHGFASSASLPLLLDDGRCLGALTVYATEANAFDQDEVKLLNAFANDIAFGIRVQRDRVEHGRARQREQETADRLRYLLLSSATIVYVIGIVDGESTSLDVTDNIDQVLGYTRAEALQPDWWSEHLHPDDRATALAANERVKAGGHQVHEYRFRHKDGRYLWIQDEMRARRAKSGRAVEIVGTWRDVSARREADEMLRKLSLAVEQSPESIVISKLDGSIEYVNEAFVQSTGYSRKEAIGSNPRILQSGKTPRSNYEGMWSALVKGQAWKGEFINRRKDGSEYVELAIVAPIRNADGTIGNYLAIKDDISEKKRLAEEINNYRLHLEELVRDRTAELGTARERAEAANQAKSTFLANMSHEIRTPMNAIIGLTHLLRHSAESPAQADRLGKIDVAARHLMSIINDILDLSKVEAGKLAIEKVDFDLLRTVDEAWETFFDRAQEKGLAISKTIDPAVPQYVQGDAVRLKQLLLNLGSNAVKFTKRGSVGLAIRVQSETPEKLILRFEVSDTGIGLSEEQHGRLFQPFEQADSSTTRQYGGTGLGLALCRRIIDLTGGSIGVESETGKGSTFWFELPVARSAQAAGVTAVAGPPAEMALRPDRKRILVVDDDEINREVAIDLLRGAGYGADAADNGRQALARVDNARYDLILMDLSMPVMDGLQATRALRARPAFAGVPIIALSGSILNDRRQQCLDAGMNDFIAKPINPDAFFATLARHLQSLPMVQPVIAATRLPAGLQNLAASGVVDIHAGLTPVMGNGEAYIALLRRYAMDRADDVRLLRRQLGEGKAVDALRTLHTLKGTAATIGAFGLEAAAIDAEAGLKRGSLAAALEPQLQGLEVAQAALLEALDRALPPPFTADGDAFDADSAQSLLVKLRALCAEDDIEAFNLYRNNAPLLRALLADDAPGIEARIDAFQFDQALALLHAATMRAD